MCLQQDKIIKIGDKMFSVFTAGSIFSPISRVLGVINEFSFRCFALLFRCAYSQIKIRKICDKKFSVFTATIVHILRQRQNWSLMILNGEGVFESFIKQII